MTSRDRGGWVLTRWSGLVLASALLVALPLASQEGGLEREDELLERSVDGGAPTEGLPGDGAPAEGAPNEDAPVGPQDVDAGASPADEADAADDGSTPAATLELTRDEIVTPLRALVLVTIFGAVPSAVLLTTCFPRVLVVLCFLRRALGTQDLPPNMVVFGLSLLLTGAVMLPVWKDVWTDAYVPFVDEGTISADEALRAAELPVKRFMLEHTLRSDLLLMIEISTAQDVEPGGSVAELDDTQRLEDLSFFTILPAFVLSELKTAFQMGFLLFLPFLLIDLLVSAVLVSMGMIMLPPALVSLPMKILVFVLVDGWGLVVSQLLLGLRVGA